MVNTVSKIVVVGGGDVVVVEAYFIFADPILFSCGQYKYSYMWLLKATGVIIVTKVNPAPAPAGLSKALFLIYPVSQPDPTRPVDRSDFCMKPLSNFTNFLTS